MAFLEWRKRSMPGWTPNDYEANSVEKLINVSAGDVVGYSFARVTEVFNGGGTDAIVTAGDFDDIDRIFAGGNVDETATGLYAALGGSGSTYTALGRHLYTADDSVDVWFTANTSGTRTTGTIDWFFYVADCDPH